MPGVFIIDGNTAAKKEGMIHAATTLPSFQCGRSALSEQLNVCVIEFSILLRPMKKNRQSVKFESDNGDEDGNELRLKFSS